MSILFSNEIIDTIKQELQQAELSVQIITAYCKESSFTYLNKYISSKIDNKKLLVRFRMDDILKGSTDFDILEFAIDEGWKVYIRFDLHAKTYIVDNKRGLVGSANATNFGLSIGKLGNMEMATLVDIEKKDIEKINKLFDDAILVDKELVDKLKKQIISVKNKDINERHMWDESITNLFNPHINTLFSYELPDDFKLIKGEYFAFLDKKYTGDKKQLKELFRWSNAYLWLLDVLRENNGCLYFGAVTEKLHNTLVSDPKPYRKDVKKMLGNMLSLIEQLEMDEVIIDRPNYSQRIRLIYK